MDVALLIIYRHICPVESRGHDNQFWSQVTHICRRHYIWFLNDTDTQDIWMLHPDRTCDHDWLVVQEAWQAVAILSTELLHQQEVFQMPKYGLRTEGLTTFPWWTTGQFVHSLTLTHQIIWGLCMSVSLTQANNLTNLSSNTQIAQKRNKFEEFRNCVDNAIKAESLHLNPVLDDETFMKCYNALTCILRQHGEAIFDMSNRTELQIIGWPLQGSSGYKLGSSTWVVFCRLQCQFFWPSLICITSCFHQFLAKFWRNSENCTDFHTFLLLHRRKLYKSLYDKCMSNTMHALMQLTRNRLRQLFLAALPNDWQWRVNTLDCPLLSTPQVTVEYFSQNQTLSKRSCATIGPNFIPNNLYQMYQAMVVDSFCGGSTEPGQTRTIPMASPCHNSRLSSHAPMRKSLPCPGTRWMGKMDDQKPLWQCTFTSARSTQLWSHKLNISWKYKGHVAHVYT